MTPFTLLGWQAPQLLTAFAAASAVMVALYLLRQQRRRVEVPFARLWQDILKQSEATSLWRKLLRLLSLLLQLVVLALLIASLGDPRLGRSATGRTLVLLIDASASMQAVVPALDGRTRIELAKAEARKLLRSLSGDDLAVVVSLDGQPAPMGGPTYDERELLRQIDEVTAKDTGADLPAALELSRALTAGRPHPQVIIISDGGFDDAGLRALAPQSLEAKDAKDSSATASPLDLRFQPLPATAHPGNLAVTAFSVRRYRRNRLSYEVLIGLSAFPSPTASGAFDTTPRRATLELLQEGEVVDVQPVALSPGEASVRLYPNLSGAGTYLTARLTPASAADDSLPLDNRAFSVLPERRKQRVLVVTRGNLFLEGALLSTGAGEENHLSVDKVTPSAYDAARASRYDVVVFDAFTPPVAPPANTIYLDPQGAGSPFEIIGAVKVPLFSDIEAQHPVLRWVSLGDVNLSKSSVFRLGPGDRALASMLKQPLIVARDITAPTGERRRSLALGFDLRQSDLPLRVAFPVLLMNALDWFAGDVDEDLGSYRTGQTWRIPLVATSRRKSPTQAATEGSAAVQLGLPDGELISVPISEGRALYYGQRTGFYSLHIDEATTRRFAGNLGDATESAALVRSELSPPRGPKLRPPALGERALRRTLWPYLLLLALLLLGVEWWTYHRRWTV